MLSDQLHRAGRIVDGDLVALDDHVHAVDRGIVFANVVEALGRADVIVELNAGRDDVDECGALMQDGSLDQRDELRLVTGECAADKARAQL
jgi:hypothetical protein